MRKRRKAAVRIPPAIVNAAKPVVSVIIPAMNEASTIRQVIVQARQVHPETEVIVVVNGSRDETAAFAGSMGARVIKYVEPLGHDVGRSIGAMAAAGSILLFVDGDFILKAAALKPFVHEIEKGADLALNKYQGPVKTRSPHPVVLTKRAFSIIAGRPELAGGSLTTIPHAMSRAAMLRIMPETLAVPPLALASAIRLGMDIRSVALVKVGRLNPKKRKQFKVDPVQPLIIGDHLEAVHWLLQECGDCRGGRTDLARDRLKVR